MAGVAAYDSAEQAERNTKEVGTAAGTAVEGLYHMPISKLCVSTNMKYKGGRGFGEKFLDKIIRKDYRGGSGTPEGY